MNQDLRIESFDALRNNKLPFTQTITTTVFSPFLTFDSPREPTSPPTEMHPARNRSTTGPRNYNVQAPALNQLKRNQKAGYLQPLKLERVAISPIDQVRYRTQQQNQKYPGYQNSQQMQNMRRNRFLTTTIVQCEQKKNPNGQPEFYKRYVEMQMECAQLKNQNQNLKKERQELLLKRQYSNKQRQVENLIQQLTASNQQTAQLKQNLKKQKQNVVQLENKLMEYSSKLDHQVRRLRELSNKKQKYSEDKNLDAQKIKKNNQLLKDNNILYEQNMIISTRLRDLQKILQDQWNSFTQQINLKNSIINNMGIQIANLKCQITYLINIAEDTNKYIQALQRDIINNYEKFISQLYQVKCSELLNMVDRFELKLTQMRQHSAEQQQRIISQEKRFKELQEIAEQLYQMATTTNKFLLSDNLQNRYKSFRQKNCSEITIPNYYDRQEWKFEIISNIFKHDNTRPTSLK